MKAIGQRSGWYRVFQSCARTAYRKPFSTTAASTSRKQEVLRRLKEDGLDKFLHHSKQPQSANEDVLSPSSEVLATAAGLKGLGYWIETYGCQMNVADSEIVRSVLEGAGYVASDTEVNADVILVNTCAIREGAEERAINRIKELRSLATKNINRPNRNPQIGVLGCMAERLKDKLFDTKAVNVIVGPDGYRDLPGLLGVARADNAAMNVQLSADETYGDIAPVRMGNAVSAFVSITRGCNNMCTYCIVPFTRGRERSRSVKTIVSEVEAISKAGKIKEITLLGQNVNSYHDKNTESTLGTEYSIAPGFTDRFKSRQGGGVRFAELLDLCASVDPTIRFRFTSPHPKDFTDDVFYVMAKHDNICKGIHLPAQSGSDVVLGSMIRGYTKQAYLDLVDRARAIVGPELEISSDFIAGFCGETEEDHEQTLDLLERVRYDLTYIFAYSERPKTRAYHRLEDDVPRDVKLRRLMELNKAFQRNALERAKEHIGREHVILVDRESKRRDGMSGLTFGLRRCVIKGATKFDTPLGTYVKVKITDANAVTLIGSKIL